MTKTIECWNLIRHWYFYDKDLVFGQRSPHVCTHWPTCKSARVGAILTDSVTLPVHNAVIKTAHKIFLERSLSSKHNQHNCAPLPCKRAVTKLFKPSSSVSYLSSLTVSQRKPRRSSRENVKSRLKKKPLTGFFSLSKKDPRLCGGWRLPNASAVA